MSDKKKTRHNYTKRIGNPAPNRGLGRGLSSLLGDVGVAAAAGIAVPKSDVQAPAPDRLSGLRDTNRMDQHWSMATAACFVQDALAELADSIRQKDRPANSGSSQPRPAHAV